MCMYLVTLNFCLIFTTEEISLVYVSILPPQRYKWPLSCCLTELGNIVIMLRWRKTAIFVMYMYSETSNIESNVSMPLSSENNQLKVMDRVMNLEKFVENCDEIC
mgnify:CR=1 FL=1